MGRTNVHHEDNQATILVAKKGYSPKLRNIARTHEVNLGSISEQLEEGTGVEIEYVDTAEQAADIFTKALVPQKWDRAIKLLGIRQKLPAVLTDKRNLTVKAGSRPKTFNPTPYAECCPRRTATALLCGDLVSTSPFHPALL